MDTRAQILGHAHTNHGDTFARKSWRHTRINHGNTHTNNRGHARIIGRTLTEHHGETRTESWTTPHQWGERGSRVVVDRLSRSRTIHAAVGPKPCLVLRLEAFGVAGAWGVLISRMAVAV